MSRLVPLVELKRYLSLDLDDNSQDAVLANTLDAADDAVTEALGGRDLLKFTGAETVDGNGSAILTVAHYPVSDVISVAIAPTRSITRANTTVPALVDIDVIGQRIERLDGINFPEGRKNVTITYTGGYTQDQIPSSIRMLVLQLASMMYNRRGNEHVQSEKVSEYSVTYAASGVSVSMVPGAGEVIRAYRRIV